MNTGRGGIIVEADLAEAIDKDLIAGAGIDVFLKEPLPIDNPLLHVKKREKLLLMPHTAWASVEARRSLVLGILKNIHDFAAAQ